MKDSRKLSFMFYIFIIFFLLSLDLLTKFFSCYYNISFLLCTLNTGSAWSMFSNISYYSLIVGILSLILVVIMILKYTFFISEIYEIPYILFISGILGNGLNRIFFSGVHDIFTIPNIPIFGIFNLADCYLTFGLIFYMYYYICKNHYN